MTTALLAKLLFDELDRDDWGDIDPFWFRMIAEGWNNDDANADEAEALRKVLDRVVKRLTT